jgi:anaerobic selenocysteine-containing dehydrogenase
VTEPGLQADSGWAERLRQEPGSTLVGLRGPDDHLGVNESHRGRYWSLVQLTGLLWSYEVISPKSHAYLNSSAGDQPAQRRVQGEQAVTVHPHDAAERGITDGTFVRVFNDRGQFVALARVTDQIAPGVVMAPMGAWRKNAKGHSTVNAVNPFVFADLGNAPTFSDTKVEIEPAESATADR